ncbi:hypothetical protein [Glaciibacter sp. 2TAF33]|uniref:hypothetical protein n=1 Tax=Glaciibacter sp. 2TAF33 TaxID=3233015 RepID=UPI003F91B42B
MRLTGWSIAIGGALLLTGCTAAPPPESSSHATTLTPTPTPLSQHELLDQQVRTAVNVYGQLVCTKLEEMPTATISALVDSFVSQYTVGGGTDAERLDTAHRMLTGAVAKYCPDQSARVAEGIAAG